MINQEHSLIYYLTSAAAVVVLIPFFAGILRFKYLGKNEKVLFLLIAFALISESVGLYFRARHTNNLLFYHIYTIAEFCTISAYFVLTIPSHKIKVAILSLLAPFLIIACIDVPSAKLQTDDSVTTSYEGILIISYCVLYFYHILQNPVYDKIMNAPPFWFVSALLLYFSGTLFVFVFSSYINQNSLASGKFLWGIQFTIGILLNILFSIGFWKTKKR